MSMLLDTNMGSWVACLVEHPLSVNFLRYSCRYPPGSSSRALQDCSILSARLSCKRMWMKKANCWNPMRERTALWHGDGRIDTAVQRPKCSIAIAAKIEVDQLIRLFMVKAS